MEPFSTRVTNGGGNAFAAIFASLMLKMRPKARYT